MTVLSVNLNKVAVIRNSRGGATPSVLMAAETCLSVGCTSLTVHPRPDMRHIRPSDVRDLGALLRERGLEFNIEGNPFAAARGEYPGLLALCEEVRPTQVTLVPDSDAQITSDHGFDLTRDQARLRPLIVHLKALGCRVSLFMDAGAADIPLAAELGADRIEIYTGPYANAYTGGDFHTVLLQCVEAAKAAQGAGLAVNAGHDLSQSNLAAFLAAVPAVAEVSIGHALFSEAIYDGLATTVQRYLAILDAV